MANLLLAYQNNVDAGTLSGGTWLASLPLVNLQSRLVQRVARSSGVTLAATKFDLDLGSTTKQTGVVAIVTHNFSVSAKVRIRGDDAADFASPVYDSGWVDVWPAGMIPQSLLEWEDDNFWLGTLSANARAGYQSPYIHALPSAQTLRYWRVEIDDTTNTDGYVQAGRFFISPAWRPEVNYALGAGLTFVDDSPIETSLSGAEYFDVRGKAREFVLTLEGLTESEAYDNALQMQRQIGISGEVLQVPDTDDTARLPARAYVGRLSDLSPIVNPSPGRFRVTLKIKELI